jgi:3-carboxymuconate cyclase
MISLLRILIGTYGTEFYDADFDKDRLSLKKVSSITASDCSYICPSEDGKYFFAVSESGISGAYSFDSELNIISYTKDVGYGPCFISLLPGTPYILTSNFGDGSVSVLETKDGVIERRVQDIQFKGSGPVLEDDRQLHSRTHQVLAVPESIGGKGKWLLATDLGGDKIHVLKYRKRARRPLREIRRLAVSTPAGSGPRHMAFNEQAGVIYCLTEISGEILVYRIKGPRLKLMQTVQAEEVGAAASGDIHLHPSGKWLYASHRNGNDGISVFDVASDGLITKKAYVRTGDHPRNFTFSPDGQNLLAACMNSHCVQVFPIDKTTGIPGACAESCNFDQLPVCLLFH